MSPSPCVPNRTAYLALPVIASLVAALYAAGFAVARLLGLPPDLALPLWARFLGLLPLAYGIGMDAWVVRFRGAGPMVESTWATFLELAGRRPLEVAAGRSEPLVVAGPYRFVRHPLYSGILGLTLGIAVLTDHVWAYLGCLALGLWFAFVLAPFEERELHALFGPPYREYVRSTRRFLPVRRR